MSQNIPAEKEFHYAVMTKDVIPGSRNQSYDAQLQLLLPEYEVPGVFDVARAVLWENRCSRIRYFSETYTRCKDVLRDVFSEYHLAVGKFCPSGLIINLIGNDGDRFSLAGVAGWRKFKVIGH